MSATGGRLSSPYQILSILLILSKVCLILP
jgi:hypothetical protein